MKKDKVDTTNEDQDYWDKILSKLDLDMSRGSVRDDPRQKKALKKYFRDTVTASISDQEAIEAGLDIVDETE